jgi:hypothetical protein
MAEREGIIVERVRVVTVVGERCETVRGGRIVSQGKE